MAGAWRPSGTAPSAHVTQPNVPKLVSQADDDPTDKDGEGAYVVSSTAR